MTGPVELWLDRLELHTATLVVEYLHGRWRQRGRSEPPMPAELADAAPLERLARERAHDRRAHALWRWRIGAAIETEAGAAFRAWRDAPAPATLAALAAARNAAARAHGFASYYDLALERDELDDDIVAFAARAPAAAIECTGLWRAAAAGGPNAPRVDARVAPGPAVARTYPIRPPDDVRVYARAPEPGALEALIAHERGHALYARWLDPRLPWALRAPAARCADEAVAMAAEPPRDADRAAKRRDAMAARADFERDLYRREGTDLASRWTGRPPAPWAAGSAIALDPGAQASYVVAAAPAPRVARVPPLRLRAALARGAARSWQVVFAEIGISL